jgi:glycosyltransferase involved in cell wall biosynthesis
MQSIYTLIPGALTIKPVGLNMSVLRRCMAFGDADIENTLLINSFQLDLGEMVSALRLESALHPSTQVRSMYADLAGDSISPSPDHIEPLPTGPEWSYVPDADKPDVSRGYENGQYRLFVWWKEGRVRFADRLNDDKKRISRSWYDPAGRLRKEEVMTKENIPKFVSFFTDDGREYLRHNYVGAAVASIELRERDLGLFCFDDERELLAFWLSEYVLAEETKATLISEYGFNRAALEALKGSMRDLRIIYTLHNNHFASPYRFGSAVKPELRDFMDHLADYDGVVVLTNEQRIDILKQYAPLDNIHVIPHHVPELSSVRAAVRDPAKIVLIGRYTSVKGQLDAIDAFREVVVRFPDATLELYGRGPDEERIRLAIAAAELQDRVHIRGFTSDSQKAFEEAAISLHPSYMEGYSLSLQESLAAGCVPVAYDFKYGARAQIANGLNGLIVDVGNTRELAAAMTLLLSDSDYRSRLSSAGRESTRPFTSEGLAASWKALFRRLHS